MGIIVYLRKLLSIAEYIPCSDPGRFHKNMVVPALRNQSSILNTAWLPANGLKNVCHGGSSSSYSASLKQIRHDGRED